MAVFMSSMQKITKEAVSMVSNKAYFQTEDGKKLYVQFNPEKFKITKSADYSSSKQKEQMYVEFSGIAQPKLEISFFFDTSSVAGIFQTDGRAATDVTALTEEFEGLLKVRANLHRPPIVQFIWGSICFPGFVKQVTTAYTMFNNDGMPIRAQVDAQVMGISQESEKKIPFSSPDRTKSRVVSDETDIFRLAGTEYGDIGKWRIIAKANGIMDPFAVPAGTALKIPALK